MVVRFLVKLARIAQGFVGSVNRRVKAAGRKPPDSGHQLPGPFNGFLFEVIAKTPVSQHLEERVVIGVEPDVVQVIVFAAGADAFLGVRGAGRQSRNGPGPLVHVGLLLAEKDGDELVHTGVRKQQVRRIGQEARRGHDGVLFRLEKIEERLADFGTGHNQIKTEQLGRSAPRFYLAPSLVIKTQSNLGKTSGARRGEVLAGREQRCEP